jgi:hypothetical protein
MVGLGAYTFAVSFVGFAVSGSDRRFVLTTYAVFLALAFLAQLVSISRNSNFGQKIFG